jgi:hypothetical protein
MTQEQARQEAERRILEYSPYALIMYDFDIKCALISINREIELYQKMEKDLSKNIGVSESNYIYFKLQDLNQIKDELLKM